MIGRRKDTPGARAFWDSVEADAREVAHWPEWKRAGVSADREVVSANYWEASARRADRFLRQKDVQRYLSAVTQ